ncbi:hypothetical protein [Mesorhizobium sp. AA22]|uniref:hypothetical protein n=1 Tax=Mesorhizobium sp. AA22 TaxID=1854057 RepID=UPI001398B87E|nr:hypothetical protein [Mesorhizobium sp. AA22]QIA20330.1 hypothetical protein A9K68_030690 [Mesorhizobium sp. AA22]
MGAIGAAPSGWTACREGGLAWRIILDSMNHRGAFNNDNTNKPPRLSWPDYVR